jgi:DNA primase
LTEQTIRRFGLGYAPPGWDNLLKAARADRLSESLLASAALVTAAKRQEGSQGRHYDTFRDRVIFPILDGSERVIGFGGRTLGDDTPKYLNTAETPLFNKRRELYGLRWGRRAIAESDAVVVVEGYTDVIMAHQAGFENVVATLGTALTDEHVRLLGRLAKRIVLIYDADEAGIKASDRALELFLAAGVDLAIGMMPEGLDPCDAIVQQGPKVFADAVAAAADALEFKWLAVLRDFRQADGTADRRSAIEAMMATLAGMAGYQTLDPIRRGLMLDRLAGLAKTSVDELNRMLLRQVRKRRPSGEQAKSEQPDSSGGAGEEGKREPPSTKRAGPENRPVEAALAQILGVLLAEPSYYDSIRQTVSPTDFADPLVRALAEPAFELARQGELSLTAVLRRIESPQLAALATDLAERAAALGPVSKVFEAAVRELEQVRQLDKAGDSSERIVADIATGKYTKEYWENLGKRPPDKRRGGGV